MVTPKVLGTKAIESTGTPPSLHSLADLLEPLGICTGVAVRLMHGIIEELVQARLLDTLCLDVPCPFFEFGHLLPRSRSEKCKV